MNAHDAAAPLAAAASSAPLIVAVVAPSLSSIPAPDVIAWSLIGGVVAVWIDRKDDVVITPLWMINALMLLGVSAVCGVGLSAALIAVGQGTTTAWLEPVRHVPHWSLAGIIAGTVHKAGPLLFNAARRRYESNRSNGGPGGSDVTP